MIGMGKIKVRGFEDLEVWQIGKMLSGLIHSQKTLNLTPQHLIPKNRYLKPKTYKTEVTKYGKNNKLE
jgi:hypothetical protein